MEEGQQYCTRQFEKLVLKKGEVAAIISSSKGIKFCETEKSMFQSYQDNKAHNAKMPDDLKPRSSQYMEVDQQSRLAIQDYKNLAGIPLDTPPVNLDAPKNFDNAANDETFILAI